MGWTWKNKRISYCSKLNFCTSCTTKSIYLLGFILRLFCIVISIFYILPFPCHFYNYICGQYTSCLGITDNIFKNRKCRFHLHDVLLKILHIQANGRARVIALFFSQCFDRSSGKMQYRNHQYNRILLKYFLIIDSQFSLWPRNMDENNKTS